MRESLVRGAVDNMKLFLRTNYNLTIKKLDTYRHGFQEAAGVAQEGLFLGTVRPGDIVACDTFLSEEMLRTDQQTLLGELHFHAHTKDWSHARLLQYGNWFQDKLGELGEE